MASWGLAQNQIIHLDDAIRFAKKNYAGLERDSLEVTQLQQLAKAGLKTPPSQFFISSEEIGTTEQLGIYALNFQQNFYVPKASRAHKGYYQKNTFVARKILKLTVKKLEWEVKKAYYKLLFSKHEQALVRENTTLFEDFLAVTTAQLNTGEKGKTPQLAARTRLGQAQLDEEHATEKYQIAFSLFNQWVGSEESFDIDGVLIQREIVFPDTSFQDNLHLQIFQAQKEMFVSEVEYEKSKLLPQLNTGVKLENIHGLQNVFGFQVGINVPLFRKPYKGRIEAAKIGVKKQEAAFQAEKQKLTQIISELKYHLEHQSHILEYLDEELKPIVEEQSESNLQAYREGEINYFEYLNSLEQVVLVKHQYLEALYEFNLLQIELEYWTGN